MPGPTLVVFGILVIGSFVYLIYDALKQSDVERLEGKLDKIIGLLENGRVEKNGKQKRNNSKPE